MPWLRRFYFGARRRRTGPEGSWSATSARSTPGRSTRSRSAGSDIVVRVGRYGPYLERGERSRANVPEGTAPDELTVDRPSELLAQPSGDRELGTDPRPGTRSSPRTGRYGPYVTEICRGDRRRRHRKQRRRSRARVAVQDDGAGHGHPGRRAAAAHPAAVVGADSTARRSPRRTAGTGPYVKQGTDSPLAGQRGAAVHDHPRRGAGAVRPAQGARPAAGAAEPPLRELGADPVSGKPMVIKDGRFGPYVTDGETNASLRKGDAVESITPSAAPNCSPSAARPAPSSPRRKERRAPASAEKSRSRHQ